MIDRVRGHPNPLFRKLVGLEDGLLGIFRNREHGRSARGRAADETHRALRERSFEQLWMRLEKNIVNGHDFGHEGNRRSDVLRVKEVETVDELECRDDERQPHPRSLREHTMMSRPAHVQEPFGRGRLKAVDLELIFQFNEGHERPDELDSGTCGCLAVYRSGGGRRCRYASLQGVPATVSDGAVAEAVPVVGSRVGQSWAGPDAVAALGGSPASRAPEVCRGLAVPVRRSRSRQNENL